MDDSTPPPLLGLALRHAHVRASRAFAKELQPLGLENPVAGVVLQLGRLGPQTQRRLVEILGSEKSAMVRYIDALEARGLVRREPHPTDRRAQWIALTEAGQAILTEAQQAMRRAEEQLLARFSPEERALFHELLVRFSYG